MSIPVHSPCPAGVAALPAFACVLCLIVCLFPVEARAQTSRITGPFEGLFGGGRPARNSQSLDFRGSVFGVQQWVQVPTDLDPDVIDPRLTASRPYAGVSGALNYRINHQMGKSAFFGTVNGFLADYTLQPDQPQYGVATNGGLGFSIPLNRRVTLTSSAQAGYTSQYSFSPGGAVGSGGVPFDPLSFVTGSTSSSPLTPGLGLAPLKFDVVDTSANVALTAVINSRSRVIVDLTGQRTFFLGDSGEDLATLGSGATYAYQLLRHLGFHVTYRRTQPLLEQPSAFSTPTNTLDFGIDYGDALALQLTRRTTLSLAVSAGSARSLTGSTQYHLLGGANLNHTMGRTWSTGAGYNRSLGFVSVFQEPVLQDSVSAFIGGQPAKRMSFTTNASFSRGYIGVQTSSAYNAYNATSVLSYAVSRRVSAFVQYSYYGSQVPPNASTLPLLSNYKRSAIVVGASLWQPLYDSKKRRTR